MYVHMYTYTYIHTYMYMFMLNVKQRGGGGKKKKEKKKKKTGPEIIRCEVAVRKMWNKRDGDSGMELTSGHGIGAAVKVIEEGKSGDGFEEVAKRVDEQRLINRWILHPNMIVCVDNVPGAFFGDGQLLQCVFGGELEIDDEYVRSIATEIGGQVIH
ncbi:hypothetical protein RFI_03409 [Reticulomyxa filosa]|uniref:Uncharacterized protein n=1 Tax=Reticulomyxa filosa TaxID=46433 RepID=X6P564_RETFI|nr:hypothetical protein RFI_03409 [Reticulomyxa filosa]|eukprot:ETO33690.1 hypothetical protein RFI_03409 [Reticulomyxa filosa]